MGRISGILFLLFLGLADGVLCQNTLSSSNKKALELFDEAHYFYRRRDFHSAADLLQQAVKKDNNFIEAYYRLGHSYFNIGDTLQAESSWLKTESLAGGDVSFYFVKYHLGRLYFQRGEYQKSFEKLVEFNTSSYQNPELKSEGVFLQECAEFAVGELQKKVKLYPQRLKPQLNQMPLQYFPVMTVDKMQLIFTGRTGFGPDDDEDIYLSLRLNDTAWADPQSISGNINSINNEGTTSISADGRILIFTSCLGRQGYGSCDLYIAYRNGDEWTEPENMGPGINSGGWESQPSLSADGRMLYYVSDREGGEGGEDIYKSRKGEDGNWGKAVNLGPQINTPRHEIGPFIHPNGKTLFFASQGHIGMGGFDVFWSELGKSGWSPPENMGYPMNDRHDQVTLFITADLEEGYYSQDIRGNDGHKRSFLYTVDLPAMFKEGHRSSFVRGIIRDSRSIEPLFASVELFNLSNGERVYLVDSDKATGEYVMVLTEGAEYALYVRKPGYLFKSMHFDYDGVPIKKPIEIDVYLDPLEEGKSTVLQNIFFAFNEYSLDPKSKTELDQITGFLNTNPGVKIQIEGHTDNIGDRAYNQDLSEKRARAVYSFLLEEEVSKSQVSFRGFGMERPVVPNDSEENRALNRRIEFRILTK